MLVPPVLVPLLIVPPAACEPVDGFAVLFAPFDIVLPLEAFDDFMVFMLFMVFEPVPVGCMLRVDPDVCMLLPDGLVLPLVVDVWA